MSRFEVTSLISGHFLPEEVVKKLEEKTKLTKEEEELQEGAKRQANKPNKVSLRQVSIEWDCILLDKNNL